MSYLLWGSICYTGVNIPYGSMASAISAEPKDRAALSSWRTIGATLAQTVIGVVLPLVVYYKDMEGRSVLSGERMAIAALFCSVFAIICYILCYKMTTERVKVEQKTEKFSFTELISGLVHNKALIGIIVCALLLLVAQLSLSNMANYIYPNYFGNTAAMSVATFLGSGIVLLLSTVITTFAAKYGKKEISIAGCLISAAAMIAGYVLHTRNVWVWVAIYTVFMAGIAVFNLVVWAMITDVIDDAEVITGERSDGTIYSVYSFARKLGQAASSGLSGFLLSIVGYTTLTAYDEKVVNGIYNISCLVPAFGVIFLALALKFLYPLNKRRVDANAAYLKAKREANN